MSKLVLLTCTKCGETKSAELFKVCNQRKSGRSSHCKECGNSFMKNLWRNLEYRMKWIGWYRRHAKTERYKESRRRTSRKQRALHPERHAANNSVNNAIRAGRLRKKPCEVCGDKKVQAHHDDYSKPLEVRWLCHTHHVAVHGKVSTKEMLSNG